jgi:hypothetical protein
MHSYKYNNLPITLVEKFYQTAKRNKTIHSFTKLTHMTHENKWAKVDYIPGFTEQFSSLCNKYGIAYFQLLTAQDGEGRGDERQRRKFRGPMGRGTAAAGS